jgi:hypothetical protein
MFRRKALSLHVPSVLQPLCEKESICRRIPWNRRHAQHERKGCGTARIGKRMDDEFEGRLDFPEATDSVR